MSQVGKYLRRTEQGYFHWCPACSTIHHYSVDIPQSNGAQWTFDGNIDAPSFSPSMLITHPGLLSDDQIEFGIHATCHYFVRNGTIEYCGDSSHSYAGKTVPLPELTDTLLDS